MHCTLCETPLVNLADEYYFVCDNCGAYVKDKKYYLDPQQEQFRYEEHNNDVDDLRYIHFASPITNLIFEKYTPEHLGLDYGCGTGPVISNQLHAKGYQVKLFDPYFFSDEGYLSHRYDYIFSCEVFEHFYHPKVEIEKLVSLLKPDGSLIILTHLYDHSKDFRGWYYRHDPTHVFIYTLKTIRFIATRFGLQITRHDDRMVVFRKMT